MIAVPRIPEVRDGQILSANLVNHIIKRTEYAADLLGQYKLITGDNTSLKQQFEGTRVNAELVEAAKFKIVGTTVIGGVTRGLLGGRSGEKFRGRCVGREGAHVIAQSAS